MLTSAMYDASKYSDNRLSRSTEAALRREVSPAEQSVVPGRHAWHRGRALPVCKSTPNCLVVDAAPSLSVAANCVVRNGGGGKTGGSSRAVNGLSLSVDRCRCGAPLFDVPATLTASLDDAVIMSPPESVASTLSSPADVQPAAGELFARTTASGRCRLVSLADEYFPVTLAGRRLTDPGHVPEQVPAATGNGRHHRRRHSHHRRHRQQGHGQGHGRPSSGHSSSSSNSRSSMTHIYPGVGTCNGAVTNGTPQFNTRHNCLKLMTDCPVSGTSGNDQPVPVNRSTCQSLIFDTGFCRYTLPVTDKIGFILLPAAGPKRKLCMVYTACLQERWLFK